MVRRIVGVMVDVGSGGTTVEQAETFLREESGVPAKLTAPASGLFLERVYYRGDARRPPLRALCRREISTVSVMSEQLIKCPSCGATNRLPDTQSGKRRSSAANARRRWRGSAGPVEVTDGTFMEQVEQSPTPVLLDLWADWCGPCHMLAPTIEQLSRELEGRVKVAKLNIDENPMTANRFGIRSIPTLLVLKGGTEVDRLVGVQPKQEIVRRLEKVIG